MENKQILTTDQMLEVINYIDDNWNKHPESAMKEIQALVKEIRKFKKEQGYKQKDIIPMTVAAKDIVMLRLYMRKDSIDIMEHMGKIKVIAIVPPSMKYIEQDLTIAYNLIHGKSLDEN